MAIEIERKFLVQGDEWRSLAVGETYRQGYIANINGRTVRVRVVGSQGYLSIRFDSRNPVSAIIFVAQPRDLWRNPVSESHARLYLVVLIEKTRYKINIGDLIWEVDEFWGENQGLILAEVELETEDQNINIPHWIGKEVTSDPRYYNSNLVKNPFKP